MNHMDFELYNAVISGNYEALKRIQCRLDVGDQLTPTNFTALHLASQYGNLSCIEEILRSHHSLLFRLNSRGETALHLAARGGHFDVTKTLIDNAAKSSIHQLNHLQIRSTTGIEFLIRTANVEYSTALHEAVRYNHPKVVKLLVTQDPSHPHSQNKNDETPLYLASLRGYQEIITIILDNCVSPTFGGPDGRTALHAAVLDNGQTECVKLLLEKKKELLEVADNYGWTGFHYAAYNNCYDIVKYLLDVDKSVAYIADIRYKKTALHVAAYVGTLRVMQELLKYCPDSWDTVDGNGRNILHIAVENSRKRMIRYILTGCSDINTLLIQKDKQGNTPLHLMAKLGCYVPEIMNHKRVDWETLNDENLTPLDVSFYNKETLLDQVQLQETLFQANVKRHWDLGITMKEPDSKTGEGLARYVGKRRKHIVQSLQKMINTHIIVAALIATVALTAGFTMPGGFDGNAGANQGSPSLLRNTAFKAFMVTDTVAAICSMSSIFIYFMTTMFKVARAVIIVGLATAVLNSVSIVALMLAFITGMYAVLAHSSGFAISVCAISSVFFLVVCYLVIIRFLTIAISVSRIRFPSKLKQYRPNI